MHMMDSLRRSFKSHVHSSSRNPSFDDQLQEHQPILLDAPLRHDRPPDPPTAGEVVVKVDGNSDRSSSAIWRDSSYGFWTDQQPSPHAGVGGRAVPEDRGSGFSFSPPNNDSAAEDPPSRLISKFLHKQRASGAEVFLDMDLEMDELKKPSSTSNSKELRVSFQDLSTEQPSRPPPRPPKPDHPCSSASSSPSSSSDDGRDDGIKPKRDDGGAEVLRCTSNSAFRHSSLLLRAKTRSRLMDPAPPPSAAAAGSSARVIGDDERMKSGRMPPRSGILKSGQLRSGVIGMGTVEEEEEDPFFDEDLPDDFKRAKLSSLTILQWLSLFLITSAVVCSLSIPSWKRQTVWQLHLWKWELLVFVLICGRLVSGWVIRIAVFFIERNFLLRKRVLYFVYGLRRAVQNCLWLGLVLISWHYMFDSRVERETNSKTLPYVTKVLFCLLIATIFRLIKTLLVKVLASSFHVSTYFDRIQEALFNQYVIETLSGPPLLEIQHNLEEDDRVLEEMQMLQNAGAKIPNDLRAAALTKRSATISMNGVGGGSGHGPSPRGSSPIGKSTKLSGGISKKFSGKQQEDAITIDHLHKLSQKNVSAWNMKRLMRIVRHGTLSTLDEQIPQARGEDESAVQIRSEHEAKIAARKIFNNVAKTGAKYIYLVDLMRFMREEEAIKTLSLFEEAQENNRISRKSLKNWVVNAFRERRALALTLNDTKTAVNKLHQMANIVVGVIVLALWLLILGLATTHFFVFLSSQALLAVFMFGNTLKMVFEAIIFLFVMHPFDVGDRCEVEGTQMIVEEMNILTTIFLKPDNTKVIYPNTLLATQPISNFYRSPDQGDAIDFCVHVSTPVEKLALMKEKIIGYMESRKDHWYPGAMVVLKDVDDMNRLKVSIWMRHKINFQDMGLKWARRETVIQEMIRVLRELEIEYRMLPLDVNCRNLPSLSSTRLPSTWTTCG